MRKVQKEQLLEICKSLHTLHQKSRNRLERKDYQAVQTALADCQEAAIQMGEAIEQIEGEGTQAVAFLEEYCERVYQACVRLETIPPQKFYKNLDEILLKAENEIKHMPVRREIAFFPYKASMWDSLESVYLEAKKDPNCDVYCVPIPYYDKNQDGSLGQIHYEGREYPKNIEVIDWQTYSFEDRKPDVIYIHNPYDNCNFVTSVHPRYYAANLKKYTEELVYIPYFVLQEIEPDDQTAIDGMKHFVWTPGVICADKVILQSEKMAQIYVNEYQKEAVANGFPKEHTDREWLKKKFLGLGSPKVDKVLNTKMEDLEIPQEWLRIIHKPDGSRKKIIFYNTGISALLRHGEKMLEKMQDVFRIFYENREEVALLWRPHPLIENTIKSMRPQLWEEYRRIVEQYRMAGWGIYDDTADMDRAVVLSDAYYGDGSSIVQLYQKTGKPVMMQSIWEKGTEVGIFDGKTVWFTAYAYNGLFSADIITKEVKFEGTFPHEDSTARMYGSAQKVGNKLYFSPFYAKQIAVYDIDKQEFRAVELDTQKCDLSNSPLFMATEVYKQYVYMFGVCLPWIIRLDTRNNHIDYIPLPNKEILGKAVEGDNAFFRVQTMRMEEKIYIPFCRYNAILELNCETLDIEIYKLGEKIQGYSGILYKNNKFWCSPREKGTMICWDRDKNSVCEIELKDNDGYTGMFTWHQKIYMPSSSGKNIICIGKDGIIEKRDMIWKDRNCIFIKNTEEYFLLYENSEGTLMLGNKQNNQICNIQIRDMLKKRELDF